MRGSFLLPTQCNAALADNLFEILDGLEIGVDQRLVHELPAGRLRIPDDPNERLPEEIESAVSGVAAARTSALVERFHGAEAAQAAASQFERVHVQRVSTKL